MIDREDVMDVISKYLCMPSVGDTPRESISDFPFSVLLAFPSFSVVFSQ